MIDILRKTEKDTHVLGFFQEARLVAVILQPIVVKFIANFIIQQDENSN